MYVGRIYPWKGLEIMAAAARRLPNILFYIVGGTADQMRAIGFAGGQPENLVFAGERPFAEMPRWMRAAHMLIVTGTAENSYSFLHTSPMKIFEYMAAERPILAARTPAIQEIFTDDGQGVVFYEPDNIDDFVRSVAVLAARPDSHVAHQETYAYEWAYRAERALRFIGERV
jgi:glycosyltransferase involved in cell wall biosynthesis